MQREKYTLASSLCQQTILMLEWNSEKWNDIKCLQLNKLEHKFCVLICCAVGKQKLAMYKEFKTEGNRMSLHVQVQC